ncbi:MAG: hypothetical protein ACLR7D_06210 [Lachnospira eligens]
MDKIDKKIITLLQQNARTLTGAANSVARMFFLLINRLFRARI